MLKSEVLERADAAWAGWREFLSQASAGAGSAARGQDGWTLGEAVAHVARWQDWAAEHIPVLAATRRLEVPPIDPQNAEWAAADREVGLSTSLERLDRAWERLRAATDAVPEASWHRGLARLVAANTWEHYEEHQEWHPAG